MEYNVLLDPAPTGVERVTELRREEVLLKAEALQDAIFNSANFSCIATDAKGVIQIFNVGAERMLGYTAAEVVNRITPADLHDLPEVIERAAAFSLEFATPIAPGFEALVYKARRGIEDIYELTKIRKDGSRFPAVVSVTALRDAQDGIIGYLLIGTDNTARHQVEEERKRAEEALHASLADRELLLREIHHRVKNNMQLVCSLLQLQARQLQNPEMIAILHESQTRVRSMALIHEKLYGGDSLARIDLADYLRSLAAMIQRSQSARTGVRLRFDLVPLTAGMDTAVPLGLTVNELLTNAFKHAFPEGARFATAHPEVVIALQREEDGRLRLEVRDNGVGLPTDFAPERAGSLGMRMVQIFAKQLHCELIWRGGSGGSVFQMSFRELKPKRPQPVSLQTD